MEDIHKEVIYVLSWKRLSSVLVSLSVLIFMRIDNDTVHCPSFSSHCYHSFGGGLFVFVFFKAWV